MRKSEEESLDFNRVIRLCLSEEILQELRKDYRKDVANENPGQTREQSQAPELDCV